MRSDADLQRPLARAPDSIAACNRRESAPRACRPSHIKEKDMQNILKLAAVLGVTVTLAACGSPEPEPIVIVEPEPVTTKF
jgi:hypothetical protein